MLPAFAKFYGMQPSEFWRLSIAEANALAEFMNEYVRRQNEAGRG